MKMLYAVQGTGNGHLSRARDIIPILKKHGKVDILISGTQADVQLEHEITYQFHGISFIFGKKGGIDLLKTFLHLKLFSFFKDVLRLQVRQYDLIINDFEPVTAWACKLRGKFSIGLCHQAAVIHDYAPKANKTDALGSYILKHYAPASIHYGFHFRPYADKIFTPVIRNEIRKLVPNNANHYTVYLPAIGVPRIIKMLRNIEVHWQVFSKHATQPYVEGNIHIMPVSNKGFMKSIASATGIICGAGFEGPAEALFLGKKLLVVPMKGQFEQQCNAAALHELGVPVMDRFAKHNLHLIKDFVSNSQHIAVNYPNQTHTIIDLIVERHAFSYAEATALSGS